MIIVTNSKEIRDLLFFGEKHRIYMVSGDDIVEDWYDEDQFDMVVVDIDQASGLRTPLLIRNRNRTIPIIGFSKQWDAESRTRFLENGGCYLLEKPFASSEMLAIVDAVNNRVGQRVKIKLYGDRFVLRSGDMMALFDDAVVKLTLTQSKVLIELARNFGKTVTRENLLKATLLPHQDDVPDNNIVDVYIAKIRKALNTLEPGLGQCIGTVWGVGYSLNDIAV